MRKQAIKSKRQSRKIIWTQKVAFDLNVVERGKNR